MRLPTSPAHLQRRSFMSLFTALGVVSALPPIRDAGSKPRSPEIVFISNPLADYLHWLFYRQPGPGAFPFVPLPTERLSTVEALVAVPEAVASAGLESYDQVEAFVMEAFSALPARTVDGDQPRILSYSDTPPSLETVIETLRAGASTYPAFESYWRATVSPPVEAQIASWRAQVGSFDPVGQLKAMHRLPFKADTLQMVAMPFHPAGSANWSPPAVYTGLFRRPDIGRVLGHEASHLLWSAAVGTDWKRHRRASVAIRLAEQREVDLEEAMCLFMQTELSRVCGVTASAYRLSTDLAEVPALKALVERLEQAWPLFLERADLWPTSIDFVLDAAEQIWS